MLDAYSKFRKQADGKKQKFTFNLDNTIRTMYIGDEARLMQVVSNLLSNAVKFTPEEGRIVFSAKQKECVENMVTVEVSVSDSGIGISEENIVKLFSPFVQVDGSISRKYGGTGLGLVLCKNIIELMDGELGVKSEEGKGSTFAFTAKFMIGHDIPDEPLTENYLEKDYSMRYEVIHDDNSVYGVENGDAEAKEFVVEKTFVKARPIEDCIDLGGLMPFINVKRGLENLKGNRKLYAVLLRSYQNNDLLAKIQEAVSAGNFKDALQSALALKSIATNIALDDLRTKMAMLEESLRGLISDDALLDKLKISTEETRKLIPRLILALEKGKLS